MTYLYDYDFLNDPGDRQGQHCARWHVYNSEQGWPEAAHRAASLKGILPSVPGGWMAIGKRDLGYLVYSRSQAPRTRVHMQGVLPLFFFFLSE